MVMMSQSELALVPTLTLKILINVKLGKNVPFSYPTRFYFLIFAQTCHPGGPDGHAGAGHGSHVGPEGPDQL